MQKPRPPIWIPGGGSVEIWRWCAEKDYVYCYLSYYGHKAALETMQGFWEEMDRLGKDRNPYRAGFLQFVGVAETEAQARELYREPAEYFYGRCLHTSPRFVTPPGYITEATQRAGVESQIAAAANASDVVLGSSQRSQNTAKEFDAIVDNGYLIIGSPDQVAEQLREVVHDLHFGQLMLLLQFGNMSKHLSNYNTRLYAEKVMPLLADLWPEWENHWWPKPMPNAERAIPDRTVMATAAE